MRVAGTTASSWMPILSDYDMKKIVAICGGGFGGHVLDVRPAVSNLRVLLPLSARRSRGGHGARVSTAIDFIASRLAENPQSLSDVTAHEFFHLWNVKRIRPRSLEPVDYTRENYTRSLWFSEGMTTTAGNIIRVRAGLLDEARDLRSLAGEIAELERRPAHLYSVG